MRKIVFLLFFVFYSFSFSLTTTSKRVDSFSIDIVRNLLDATPPVLLYYPSLGKYAYNIAGSFVSYVNPYFDQVTNASYMPSASAQYFEVTSQYDGELLKYVILYLNRYVDVTNVGVNSSGQQLYNWKTYRMSVKFASLSEIQSADPNFDINEFQEVSDLLYDGIRILKKMPPCPSGYKRSGASCVSKCSQNESWDEDTQTCGCISGTNKMPSGLCANCPIGQDSDAAGNCLPACPSGWHSQLVGDGSNICVQDGYTSGSTSSGVAVRELDPAIYSGGGKFIYNPDGSSIMVNSSGQITQNCDTSALCTPVTSTSPSIYVASTGLVVGGFLVTSAGALTVPFDTSISTPVIAAGLGMIYSGLGLAGYTFFQDTMGNPVNPSSTAEKTFVMDISNFNTGASGGSSGSPSSGSVMGTSGDVTTYSTTGSNGSRMIVQVNSQTGEVVGFATKANSDEIEKVVHFNAAPNDPNNLAPDSSKVIDPIVVTPSAGSTSTGTVTWVWPDGTVDSYTFEPQTNTYTKSPVSSTNTNDGSTSGGSTSGGSTSGGTTSGGSTSGGTTSGGSTSGGSTSGGTTSGGSTSGGTSSGTGTSTGTGTSSGTGTTDGSGTSTGTGTGSGGSMGDGQTSGAAGTDTGSGDTTAGNSDFGSGFGDFDSFPNWQDFTDKLKSFTDDAKNKFSSVGQSVADAKDAMKNGIETKPISSGSGCNLYISTKFGSADLANSIDRVAVVFNPVITVLLTILFMWLQIMFFIKVYMFKGNS